MILEKKIESIIPYDTDKVKNNILKTSSYIDCLYQFALKLSTLKEKSVSLFNDENIQYILNENNELNVIYSKSFIKAINYTTKLNEIEEFPIISSRFVFALAYMKEIINNCINLNLLVIDLREENTVLKKGFV